MQLFLHSSRQKVIYNGRPLPQHCPFSWGIWTPIYFTIPWAILSPQSKRHHHRFSCFLTGDRSVSLYFTMGASFPQIAPSYGYLDPISTMIPWTHPSPQPEKHLDGFSRFCTDDRRVSQYFNGTVLSSSRFSLPMGDLDSHLIHHSLGPPESTTQTASRSVHRFLQGSLV